MGRRNASGELKMTKNNNQQTLSAIVGIVAVVGLVMLISGAKTVEVYDPSAAGGIQCTKVMTANGYVFDCGSGLSEPTFGFGGPSGAQTVEVYREGGQQCARMLTDAGIVIDCGIDIGTLSTGFDTPSKVADQQRPDFIQGSFEADGGVTAFGAESRGSTFGVPREFTQGTGAEEPYLGINCWDTPQGRVCVGFD